MVIEASKGPIFLIGLFRSGSTFLWNVLRHSKSLTCYYEPLHEHLLEHIATPPLASEDPTHLDVFDYWNEYRSIPMDELKAVWQPWYGRNKFFLEANEDARELKSFFDLLRNRAENRPVFKCVRACFRVDWIKANFPDSTLIYIKRNPWDIWESFLGKEGWAGDGFVHNRQTAERGFLNYLVGMLNELGIAEFREPYQAFYAFWKLSNQMGERRADAIWVYEDVVRDFDSWSRKVLLEMGFLDEVPSMEVHSKSVGPNQRKLDWYLREQDLVDKSWEPRVDTNGADWRISYLADRLFWREGQYREMQKALAKKSEFEVKYETQMARYDRIENHPVVGRVLKYWRRWINPGI